MARNRKVQSQRYYYQNCLKDPIKVNGITKHIELPYPNYQSIPVGQRFYVGQLIKRWGYNVQYQLLPGEVLKQLERDLPEPIVKRAKARPLSLSNKTNQLKLL